jgi:hypothetical protein
MHVEVPTKTEQLQLDDWLELVMTTHPTEETTEKEVAANESDDGDITSKVETMTKAELDAYAAEQHGIQLDRRQSKIKMIDEFIQKLKEKN